MKGRGRELLHVSKGEQNRVLKKPRKSQPNSNSQGCRFSYWEKKGKCPLTLLQVTSQTPLSWMGYVGI